MKKQILKVDENKGKVELINQVRLDPLLEANKREKLNDNRGYSKRRTLRKVGSIPIDVLISMGERGVELLYNDRKLRRFLKKHPEYRTVEIL